MEVVNINRTALILMGVGLQANVPEFANQTVTQLTNTTTFQFIMAMLNGNTGNAMYDELHELYVSAFGNGTEPSEVHQMMVDQLPHDNRCPMEVRVTGAMVAIATAAVTLRLYSRWMLLGRVRWDDIFIVAALGFVWTAQIFCVISCRDTGAGCHIWDITYEQLKPNLFYAYMIYLMYIPALIFFIKLSFLYFYSLLSTERKFRLTCKLIAVLFTAITVMDLFAHLFSCNMYYWNDPINRTCVDLLALDRACGSLHIVTDIMILCLPFFVITPSTLPFRDKLGLIGFFALGFLICLMTLMRVLSLVSFHESPDIPYVQVNTAIWVSTEANLALVVSCLPALRQLFLYWSKHTSFGKLTSSGGSIINVLVHHRAKGAGESETHDLEAGRRKSALKNHRQGTFGSSKGSGKLKTVMIELPRDGSSSFSSRLMSKLSSMASSLSTHTRTWIGVTNWGTTHTRTNNHSNRTGNNTMGTGSDLSTGWTMTQNEVEDVERIVMGGGLRAPPAAHRGASPQMPRRPESSWLNLYDDEDRDVSSVAKDLYGDNISTLSSAGEVREPDLSNRNR